MSFFSNGQIFILVWVVIIIQTCRGTMEKKSDQTDYVMDESIKDLFDDSSMGEGRQILFDRFGAFNTSTAFFIPLFFWKLPGIADVQAAGWDGKPFGVIAIIIVILTGGLGIAIHTITNGGISSLITSDVPSSDSTAVSRSFGNKIIPERIQNHIYKSIENLPDVLDLRSCIEFSICEAHAEPEKYGMITWPVRLLMPANLEEDERNMTEYEKAAVYGHEKKDDCHYEYPCLVQSLVNMAFYSKMFSNSIMENYK